MAVTNRGQNWYVYYWTEDDAGRRKKKWESFGKGQIAEARARQRDLQIKGGRVRIDSASGLTVAGLLEEYHNKHLVEDTTRSTDFYRIDRVLIPELGSIFADALNADDLDAFVTTRTTQGRSLDTVVRELGILRSAYSWAESRQPPLVVRHPLRGYRVPRGKSRGQQVKINPISQADFRALLNHAPPHLIRAMMFQWYGGERPGREVLGILWSDVDWDHGEIRIRSAHKGAMPERYVPIHPGLRPHLEAWKEEDNGLPDSCPIVHYNKKAVLSIKTAWRTTKQKAGITRRLRLYDFRHAWFTNVLRAGGDLKSASEIGGHSRADTTMIFYQHTVREQHREAVGMVPEVLVPLKR